MGVITLIWVVWGFSLCFGSSGWFIGDPSSFPMLQGVDGAPLKSEARGKEHEAFVGGIPGLVFAAYQGMFAVITPALMTGAFAERIKFGPFILFVVLTNLTLLNLVTGVILENVMAVSHQEDEDRLRKAPPRAVAILRLDRS